MTEKPNRSLTEALRAARLPKRKPTEDDRPPPRPFPGRKSRFIPGQLTFNEIDTARKGADRDDL
jgi:hypothetical protein